MADSVFHSVAHTTDFATSYGPYGTVYMTWSFDVRITIYEEPRSEGGKVIIGSLGCAFPASGGAVARFEAGSMTGTGGGFYNAAGIMWGNATFTPQSSPLRLPPYGNDSDSESLMRSQLNDATSAYFVRFAFNDNDPTGNLITWAPPGSHFSRYIYLDELDDEGNLPSLVLARMFARYYDHDDATDDTSSYPYAARVEETGIVTSELMNIDWRFYPWARKMSAAWKSCNRDYGTPSGSRSAYLRRKESGAWQDVLNTMQKKGNVEQMAWRKSDGKWKYALPYGDEQ